jgi:hypothetical protein
MNYSQNFHPSQIALVLTVQRYSLYGSLASSSIAFLLALSFPFVGNDFAKVSIFLSQLAAAATCVKLSGLKRRLTDDSYSAIVNQSRESYANHLEVSYKSIPLKHETVVLEAMESEKPTYYNWDNIEDEAVGFLICGNSGSAKSSLATWLAGHLSKREPIGVLALDPHYNDCWKLAGITSVGKIELIEAALIWLLKELDARCDRKGSGEPLGDPLLIICDELNAALERFKDKKVVESALKRLGSEGRKFGLTFCGLNQSSNVNAIGIDSRYRSNYALILLGQSARSHPQLGKQFADVAYPCLLDGSIAPTIAIHPTHGHYSVFKKKGNPPKNLMQINQLPLPQGLLNIIGGTLAMEAIDKSSLVTALDWQHLPNDDDLMQYPHLKKIVNFLEGKEWTIDNKIKQGISIFKNESTPIDKIHGYLQLLKVKGILETRNTGRNALEARIL